MFYDARNNTLVYDTGQPNEVIRCSTGAELLTDTLVAVPATLMNMQGLARIGLTTPEPMTHYDWPIKPGWTPLSHQKVTANHMVLHPKSFVFNEMGTMKTLSALWAADFIMREENNRGHACRCLVVAPLSILSVVWGTAIFNHFIGRRTVVVLHGSAAKRQKLLERDVDFYIINPDGIAIGLPAQRGAPLTGLAADLAKRTDIQIAVVDEAGCYRIASTRRHKAARTLLAQRPYLWMLTGTPTPNGPFDAYGLARLVGLTGKDTAKSFKWRVMEPDPRDGSPWPKWIPRASSSETVHKLLQPAIRFSGDLLNLPPCTPEQREVQFSKEQAEAYKALKKFAVHVVETGEMVKAVNQAVLRMKLIQVAAGVVYGAVRPDGTKPSISLNPHARIEEVRSIIEDTERKVIVFASLTNALIMLYEALKEFEREIINGEVPFNRRSDILRRFGDREDKLRVLLLDPATVSHGVNELVSASVAIWYCPTDKSEHYQQGNKRIHRPGQTGPTKIIQLVSTAIEKAIYSRLEKSEDMQGVILKLVEDGK